MSVLTRIAIALLLSGGAALLAVPVPFASPSRAAAATCTSSVGPGIPPPAVVPSGLPGFHAAWYGQSGYPTLCPGQRSTATVAFYNSGSRGWLSGRLGEMAFLGTSNPIPGQDRASPLGGDGTNGSPATGWPRYNRVAAQPALWVGPNQVSWFQFTIQAPTTPGSYRLYIRPLIEGALWMEDFGVYWQVTVKQADAIDIGPTDAATLDLGSSRSYAAIANGPLGCVDLAFVDAASYPGDGTFADFVTNDSRADLSANAYFATINGFAYGGSYANCVALAANGTIAFTVASATSDAYVRPIVFQDVNGSNALDLDSANRPVETVAVGGSVRFLPAQGNVGSQTVVVGSVNTAENFFTNSSQTVTFRYDANDAFQYSGSAISLAQFEAALSSGDTVFVNYIPNANGASTFNLTNDVGRGAPFVRTTVDSYDGGSTQNDVRVQIFEPSSNANGIPYSVQRATASGATVTCSSSSGTYRQIAAVTIPTGSDSTAYVDEDRPSGTYCYRVGVTNPVNNASAFGYGNPATIANPPTPVGPPTSLDARVTTNGGFGTTFDAGDVVKIAFSEAMSAPPAGAVVRAQDADGTVADVICGTNATCVLNASSETLGGVVRASQTVLTISLTANPTIVTAGTTATLRIGATVVDSAGITDLSATPWNIDGSADIVLGSPD
jgi:hypothetical protein